MSAYADKEESPKIVVEGEAEVLLEPDYIEWVVDIRTRDQVPKIARTVNNRILESLLDIADKADIGKKDIFYGDPMYEQEFGMNSRNEPDIEDYSRTEVYRRVVMIMRDMDELDEMIDAVQPLGVIYSIRRKSTLYDATVRRVKTQALKNARMKAIEQAAALGQNIGKAIDVDVSLYRKPTETWASFGPAEPVEVDDESADAAGKVRVVAYANVSFRLD
ncbi:MAG: SIMPL domain-containing protein [Phycisphaeraceae bacterium]